MYKFNSALMAGSVVGETNTFEILCPLCSTSCSSLREMGHHYRDHTERVMTVPCLVKYCSCVFDIFSSYTSHMARKHRNICLEHLRDEFKCIKTVTVDNSVGVDESDMACNDGEACTNSVNEMPSLI